MKHLFSQRALRVMPALLTVGLLVAAPAFAQPETGGPAIKDNPPNAAVGGGRGGNRPDRAAMQAQMLKRQLERAGITDAGVQEAVTTYVANRQAARKPFTDAAAALAQTVGNTNATPEQTATALANYKTALAAEKTRVATAESDLDGVINYSKDPKLEAALTMMGVIGDGQSYLDNGGRGGFGGANRGGFGGANGGGFGGANGGGFGGGANGGGANGANANGGRGRGRGGNRGGNNAPAAN